MRASNYLFLERPIWTVVFWASYVAFLVLTALVTRRERTKSHGDNRDRGSRALIYLLSLIGALIAFAAPNFYPAAKIRLPHEPLFFTAMTMFWSGALLYDWAVLTLGVFFRTSVTLLDGQRLVTRGPYRLLRHPAYTGGILVFAGIGLAMGNWVSLAGAMLAVIVAYAWRIHVEEIALRERFGDAFEAHRRRTWAVIPFVW